MVRRRVPKGVEIPPAPVSMSPTLRMHTFYVGPHIQKVRPLLCRDIRGIPGACDVRLPAVAEFQLRTLAAIRTLDQQHGCSRSSVRDGRGSRFVYEMTI